MKPVRPRNLLTIPNPFSILSTNLISKILETNHIRITLNPRHESHTLETNQNIQESYLELNRRRSNFQNKKLRILPLDSARFRFVLVSFVFLFPLSLVCATACFLLRFDSASSSFQWLTIRIDSKLRVLPRIRRMMTVWIWFYAFWFLTASIGFVKL